MNPIMVEVDSIEKLNDDLIQKAPDLITKKTVEEIEEFKELMGQNGEDSARFLNLINELANTLTYFNQGVLYRNKRVFLKIRQINQVKRSISNYSNSSNTGLA